MDWTAFLLGMAAQAGLNSLEEQKTGKNPDAEMCRGIAGTLAMLGRTLPPETDISGAVDELKAKFLQIDRSALTEEEDRVQYEKLLVFFYGQR